MVKDTNNIGKRLQEGDKKAFEELYDRYSNALYGLILRMVKEESTAKDVLQETFVKIWKNASKYNPEKAKVFTWMYQIARNTAIDKIRQLQIRSSREISSEKSNIHNISVSGVNPDTVDLPEILNQIDEKYRHVIGALFYGGLTQKEASEQLNLPLGTIKTRLRIGLRELREIFNDPIVLTAFSTIFF